MAVVQISRIQQRRGRKNAGSGLPQLASGELGWAVDSQELFIGNGAVSEGAPLVGNTKILTEHDNLFDFASTYSYRKNDSFIQTGPTPTSPIERTLQQRLDDFVDGKNFGLTGDGTDQTQALQRAIDQLFLNPATSIDPASRVVLHLSAGTYVISDTVYLPPYANIRGDGIDKTIIRCAENVDAPMFKTVNSNSTPGNYQFDGTSITQSKFIELKNLSLEQNNDFPILVLQSCRNSVFEYIKFDGNKFLGNNIVNNIGIQLNSLSTTVSSNNNYIRNCSFNNMSYAVESSFDIQYNTFESCSFDTLGYGINFGKDTTIGLAGQITGPSNNNIRNCDFIFVRREAVIITEGTKNILQQNRFSGVGNDGGTEASAIYSVINFVKDGNVSVDSYFDRSILLGYDPANIINKVYVPEILGPHFETNTYTHNITLSTYGEFARLFRLPAPKTVGYTLTYLYTSDGADAMRKGTLSIVYNDTNDTVELVDDFDFTGTAGTEENLQFRVLTSDENSDGNIDTLVVEVLNSTPDVNAKLQYTIETRV